MCAHMYFGQIHLFSLLSNLPSVPPPLLPLNFRCSVFNPVDPLSAAGMCVGVGTSTGAWVASQGLSLEENCLFS